MQPLRGSQSAAKQRLRRSNSATASGTLQVSNISSNDSHNSIGNAVSQQRRRRRRQHRRQRTTTNDDNNDSTSVADSPTQRTNQRRNQPTNQRFVLFARRRRAAGRAAQTIWPEESVVGRSWIVPISSNRPIVSVVCFPPLASSENQGNDDGVFELCGRT